MKKIATYFLCIVVITSLFSCQKQVDWDDLTTPPPTAPTSLRVKTYTEEVTVQGGGSLTYTSNLEYDANNRLTLMVSASDPGDKFVWKYNTGGYTLDLYNKNVLSIHQDGFLNSSSLIDSTVQYNDTQDTMTEKYLYNSARQLIKLKQYDYKKATGSVLHDTHDYTYDSKGNILSEKDSFSVTTYDYYPDLLNNIIMAPEYFYRPKNLPKVTKYTNGGSTETTTHTYKFDSNNRQISETKTTTGGGVDYTVIKSYTYY